MSADHPDPKFKRKLLAGVVEENLEAIAGKPRGSLRRARQARVVRRRRLAVAASTAAAVALTASAFLFADRSTPPASDLPPTTTSRPPVVVASFDPVDPAVRPQPRPLLPATIPLSVRRIAVDPGHGGVDGGTSLAHGLLEKDLTLDIGLRLASVLGADAFEPILTRHDDTSVSLRERAAIANRERADLFVSIHVNWLPDRTARGVETYYLGATDDPFLERLAATENRDSGFALADYRELLNELYAGVRADESRRLAASLQAALTTTLHEVNPEIVGRGVMQAPFAVLIETDMPAALAEVACISNDREARLLSQPRYRQRIAEALAAGITGYARSVVDSSGAIAEKGS
jgi:N-acetylmuramoyl-L-alanine amidase